jgi:hypothetical protein
VALGLGSCLFAGVATEIVSKIVDLKDTQILRIAQAVGQAQ